MEVRYVQLIHGVDDPSTDRVTIISIPRARLRVTGQTMSPEASRNYMIAVGKKGYPMIPEGGITAKTVVNQNLLSWKPGVGEVIINTMTGLAIRVLNEDVLASTHD